MCVCVIESEMDREQEILCVSEGARETGEKERERKRDRTRAR